MKTEHVPRVNQLDSIQLDDDIIKILREQLTKAFRNLSPGFLGSFQPEIDLIIRSTVWRLSIGRTGSTFGQDLLFSCYDPDQLTRKKLTGHYILTVLAKYVRDMVAFRLPNHRRIQRIIEWGDNAMIVFWLLNFFRFLSIGKKPSITDLLLGLDYISLHGNKRRDVGYATMTRELIWSGLMEFIGQTIPLINYHVLRRKWNAIFKQQKEQLAGIDQKPKLTVGTVCAYCNDRPIQPHHMGCSHIFCYYCLQGNLIADEQFQCPLCDWTAPGYTTSLV